MLNAVVRLDKDVRAHAGGARLYILVRESVVPTFSTDERDVRDTWRSRLDYLLVVVVVVEPELGEAPSLRHDRRRRCPPGGASPPSEVAICQGSLGWRGRGSPQSYSASSIIAASSSARVFLTFFIFTSFPFLNYSFGIQPLVVKVKRLT